MLRAATSGMIATRLQFSGHRSEQDVGITPQLQRNQKARPRHLVAVAHHLLSGDSLSERGDGTSQLAWPGASRSDILLHPWCVRTSASWTITQRNTDILKIRLAGADAEPSILADGSQRGPKGRARRCKEYRCPLGFA